MRQSNRSKNARYSESASTIASTNRKATLLPFTKANKLLIFIILDTFYLSPTSNVQRQLLKYLMTPLISFLTGHDVEILYHFLVSFLSFTVFGSRLPTLDYRYLPLPLIPFFTPCSNSNPTTTRGEVGEGRS